MCAENTKRELRRAIIFERTLHLVVFHKVCLFERHQWMVSKGANTYEVKAYNLYMYHSDITTKTVMKSRSTVVGKVKLANRGRTVPASRTFKD